ncbi:hypothetical protein ABW20_dc0103530 [Dactylellina cionopaga]|nr:hypothetical protein ABW20_dc0103530 [Dactylellina cionopaga]
MEQLSSLSNLGQNIAELQKNLFPSIQDLTLKLDLIDEKIDNINDHFRSVEVRAAYLKACQKFKPSEAHTKMFSALFGHIRDDYKNMSLWLFAEQSYREWQDLSDRTTSLFCLKGPRGFGKSVKMTCAIKRLMEGGDRIPLKHSLVLYFYFKRGDGDTQYTYKALESLCSQLLDQKLITNDVELIKKCTKIIENTPSAKDSSARGPENSKSPSVSVHYLVTVFKNIAGLLDRPIFIAVDGVDECEDRAQAKLLHWLKDLCRSPTANIKIICSSRDNINIESLLQDEAISEKPELPADIKTLLIDEKSNEVDLRMYLMKKVESIVLRRVGGKRGPLFDQELERVVDIIQTKANGNFTYATMVVANLQQPTKSTLESKLSKLPPAMEGMYRRSLEVLTVDEQSLVVFALKWVTWGTRGISLLEVIEHYKEIYRSNESSGQTVSSSDDGKADKLDLQSSGQSGDDGPQYNLYSNPEISDTRFHLRNSGCDFFQFDDNTDSIDAHLSVIEWIQNEAKQFAEITNKPTAPIFKMDENGQWIVSFPVPGKYHVEYYRV